MNRTRHYHQQPMFSATTWLLLLGFVLPGLMSAQEGVLAPPLLPGAAFVDVTQAPYHAVPNDALDDTQAIQSAINAAAERCKGSGLTRQQIVYFPPGEYLVSDTLAAAKNMSGGKMEGYQWFYGSGCEKTIIRLRRAADSGRLLGSASQPRPVVQTAEYRKEKSAPGNINFQLWVTDLSIVVPEDQPNAVGLSFGSANMGGNQAG